MKKKQIFETVIEKSIFPDTGVAVIEGHKVEVKHTLPGQKVRIAITKVRKGASKARLLLVLSPSPLETENRCPHCEDCGGCSYQKVAYEEQLKLLETQMRELFAGVIPEEAFGPVIPSPIYEGYRNKMELTFGDEEKDGPLVLGLHKRGSKYDLTPVTGCRIMDEDFRKIVSATQEYFRESGLPFYHRMRHEGYLRHLLIRKAAKTGEILIDLVTTSQISREESEWAKLMLSLDLKGHIVGILNTTNDSLADVIADQGTGILYGQNHFEEELLGLKFKITPFSFFQTNSLGAEVLYETAREFVGDVKGKRVYDLYSGTGTIAQILAQVASEVTGVEIVEEAVEAAKENARRNGLDNCTFIAGDVLKVLDSLTEKPDAIILDPPREGIHPKALPKIIAYGMQEIIYISCKPTSLKADLEVFSQAGYEVKKCRFVDMFPGTAHVETVVLMSKKEK